MQLVCGDGFSVTRYSSHSAEREKGRVLSFKIPLFFKDISLRLLSLLLILLELVDPEFRWLHRLQWRMGDAALT